MNIILKHTLKSARKNRLQIVMIVATVMVVVAMLFASLSMFDIFFNINAAEFVRLAADADMIVGQHYDGDAYSKSELNDILTQAGFGERIEYQKHFIKMSGVLRAEQENIAVLIEATDLQEYMSQAPLYGQSAKGALPHPAVVVSQRFAGENNLRVGDEVELFLASNQQYKKFSIYGMAKNSGIFASGVANNVLIDLKDAEGRGLVNVTLIKFKDKDTFASVEQLLADKMPDINVGEALNTTSNREIALNNTLLFTIALLFIVGMMVLILVTSYMIVVKSRLNEMIIFKTAGATPVQTTLIMLFEALLYASLGALLGLGVGRGGMALAEGALLKNFTSAITYEWWKWALAFVAGIICAAASALVPIVKLSGKTIRQATSGSVKEVRVTRPAILIGLLVAMGVVIVLMRQLSIFYLLALSAPLIVLIAIFIFRGAGSLHLWVSKLWNKVCERSVSRLSAITTRRNGAVHNVSVLLATVTAFAFMVVAVISFINIVLAQSQSRYYSDYVVEYRYLSDVAPQKDGLLTLERKLQEYEGVERAYLVAQAGVLWKDDSGKYENADRWVNLVGLGSLDDLDYIIADKSKLEYIKRDYLPSDNPAICNIDIIKRFNLKIGDKLHFLTKENDIEKDYEHFVTVVGIDYTATAYDRYIYTNLDVLYDTEESLTPSIRYFVLAPEEDGWGVYGGLRTMLEGEELGADGHAFIFEYDRWLSASAMGLGSVQSLLTLLQIVICLVAFLGIINIAIVTAYDRASEYNIYKFSGMSLSDYLLHALGESVIIGIVGIMVASVVSFCLYQMMPALAIAAGKYMLFSGIGVQLGVVLVAGLILFCFLWYVIAKRRKTKFDLMKSQNTRLI